MVDESLTPEEMDTLEQLGYGYPKEEEKANIINFFKKVIVMEDTTRTANLMDEELGLVKVPVRPLLNLSLYCKQMGLKGLASHFLKESQIITNSSLSREGFLDKLAVTQKREMETKTKKSATVAQRKNWFKKKEPAQE